MIQAGLHPTAEQVAANMQALVANKGNLRPTDVQMAAHKENIETNQQKTGQPTADSNRTLRSSRRPPIALPHWRI